jgi:hypothetical protein
VQATDVREVVAEVAVELLKGRLTAGFAIALPFRLTRLIVERLVLGRTGLQFRSYVAEAEPVEPRVGSFAPVLHLQFSSNPPLTGRSYIAAQGVRLDCANSSKPTGLEPKRPAAYAGDHELLRRSRT